jgi:3-hydroxyacyl-CoA dehydrogenase/enoyl-CoA hydratase/3-hydroxybutyryl-CoA epimerase
MTSLSLTKRPDGIAVVTFDTPGVSVNVLDQALFDEFAAVLDAIEADAAVRAVVVASAKRDSFVAGADLKHFLSIRLPVDGERFARAGQGLLDRIARGRRPFVAAMHGATLGGGLEIALACHARLATDDPKTIFGLPEVTLGLLPAGGGTQRLPRAIGLRRALAVMLTGERIRAREALRLGLVDALIPPFRIVDQAVDFARRVVGGDVDVLRPVPSIAERALELPIVRKFVLNSARARVLEKTRGNYPAPLATLRCVEVGLDRGLLAGYDQESGGFGRLCASPEAKSLIRIFLARTELKKRRGRAAPRAIERVGVVGAGLMGAGIAAVSLERSPVVLHDASPPALGRGVRAIDEGLAERVRSGALTRLDADRRRSRLRPTTDLDDLARADLVVEAVYEELELKRALLAEVEARVADETIFASNTSALPIHEIAVHARRPERVVGMHYFSPVQTMPLVEIVAAATTADWAVETARAYGLAQGKTAIVVKDGPGFYTTRILAPLLDEGADVRAVDEALRQYGFPVGPFELCDEVGLDVVAHVSESLGHAFAARGLEGTDVFGRMIANGFAGHKTGLGFYRYDDRPPKGGRPVNESVYTFFSGERRELSAREAGDRLCLLMVNEAMHCLQEGIITSPSDGDVGAVLGVGFPPFRGGPFRFVDTVGAGELVDHLEAFARRLGPRYLPAPLLVEMATEGTSFHSGPTTP